MGRRERERERERRERERERERGGGVGRHTGRQAVRVKKTETYRQRI